jgi:hypothetical protein
MDNNNIDKNLGWGIPTGTLPCWVISDSDRLNSIQKKQQFSDCFPSCYFKFTKRLDNNYIQGELGHRYEGFHKSINSNSYDYIQEYKRRKDVYFSFDRITLYKLMETIPANHLTIILKRIDNPKSIISNHAFMIMPFKFDKLNEFYKTNIRDYLKTELQISVFRADDFNNNDIIIYTIYNQIEKSEFIITDTSYVNKNVFFEFGYAAAKDKEIITIQNTNIEQNLFFDRAHIRAIFYSLDNIPEFQERLKNTIKAISDKVASKN